MAKLFTDVEMGTGNVFADLGLPDPQERQLRVKLAVRLNALLDAEGLTQTATGKRLGIAPVVITFQKRQFASYATAIIARWIYVMPRNYVWLKCQLTL